LTVKDGSATHYGPIYSVTITIKILPTPVCPIGNDITSTIIYTTTADPLKIFVADYWAPATALLTGGAVHGMFTPAAGSCSPPDSDKCNKYRSGYWHSDYDQT